MLSFPLLCRLGRLLSFVKRLLQIFSKVLFALSLLRPVLRDLGRRPRTGYGIKADSRDSVAMVEALMALYRSADLGRTSYLTDENLESYVPPVARGGQHLARRWGEGGPAHSG
jgi:hypothetical protein